MGRGRKMNEIFGIATEDVIKGQICLVNTINGKITLVKDAKEMIMPMKHGAGKVVAAKMNAVSIDFFEKLSLTLEYCWRREYIVPVLRKNIVLYFNTRTWEVDDYEARKNE